MGNEAAVLITETSDRNNYINLISTDAINPNDLFANEINLSRYMIKRFEKQFEDEEEDPQNQIKGKKGTRKLETKPYKYYTYGELTARMEKLSQDYPKLIKLETAQELYHLPSPGTCKDKDRKDTPCLQYIIHLTNHENLEQHPNRPEVFLSGALHGDEQVGPLAVMETLELLASASYCYQNLLLVEEGKDDEICISLYEDFTREELKWLDFLVQNRLTTAMVMTNAIGFDHINREENRIDPNRDFPYMKSSQDCMRSITARSLNEVWRNHLFQIAVTFHGGTESISYEWGSPNHPSRGNRDISPDDTAQEMIAGSLSAYAGSFPGTSSYPYGRINSMVYPVTGGMEDWAYAASWENEISSSAEKPITSCQPNEYGGGYYANVKSVPSSMYSNITFRAFNFLVETSNSKRPREEKLGNNNNLLEASSSGSGHVTRNIRLSLLLIDLVEPYIDISKIQSLSGNGTEIAVDWSVGGSMTIDKADLFVGKKSTCLECRTKEDFFENAKIYHQSLLSENKPMNTRWKKVGTRRELFSDNTKKGETNVDKVKNREYIRESKSSELPALGKTDSKISSSILIDNNYLKASGDVDDLSDIYIMIQARVDENWSQNEKHEPDVPPQSHLVNARTNPHWYASISSTDGTGKHIIQGRTYWLSEVYDLRHNQINDQNSYSGFDKDSVVSDSNYGNSFNIDITNVNEASKFIGTFFYSYFSFYTAVLIVIVLLIVITCLIRKRHVKGFRAMGISSSNSDEKKQKRQSGARSMKGKALRLDGKRSNSSSNRNFSTSPSSGGRYTPIDATHGDSKERDSTNHNFGDEFDIYLDEQESDEETGGMRVEMTHFPRKY